MEKKLLFLLLFIIIPQLSFTYFNDELNMEKNKNGIKSISLIIEENNNEFIIGNKLQNELLFKNNTNVKQQITYIKPNFWFPIVKEINTDKILAVSGEVYNGPAIPIQLVLNPNESINISSWPIHLITSQNEINESKMICKAGKYNIQYKIPITLNNKNQILTSNIIQITIK